MKERNEKQSQNRHYTQHCELFFLISKTNIIAVILFQMAVKMKWTERYPTFICIYISSVANFFLFSAFAIQIQRLSSRQVLILFRGCSWMGGDKKSLLPKICHTYPTMMKVGTIIPFLKKIQKIHKSCDTPLAFCLHQHFFTGNQQLLVYISIHNF